MRTKALLIAAAALAVTVISLEAQGPVYSQNIVGYYNTTIPANKMALVAIELYDASGTYQINSQLTTGIYNNSALFIWNGSAFDNYTFYEGYGWYDQYFNLTTNSLPSGTSAFLLNGSPTTPITNTVVGTVPTSVTTHIPAGFGVYSMAGPIATNIDSAIGGFPCQNNDAYFHWDVASQGYDVFYTYYAGYGWYDQAFNQVNPITQVGEGFFYQNNGDSTNWNYNYSP